MQLSSKSNFVRQKFSKSNFQPPQSKNYLKDTKAFKQYLWDGVKKRVEVQRDMGQQEGWSRLRVRSHALQQGQSVAHPVGLETELQNELQQITFFKVWVPFSYKNLLILPRKKLFRIQENETFLSIF